MINNKISEKQRERFELIETIAYWERSLNANILKQFLRLTWNMAIKELGVYKELHPKTFEYNQSLRVFTTNEGFTPVYISTDWSLYHDHLIKYSTLYNEHLWSPNSVVIFPNSLNKVRNEIIQGVTQAIKNKRTIKAKYCSMNNPKGITRRIHPHAIAFDGRRWHLRAYSESHDEFRDFNLSRITKIELEGISDIDSLNDKEWHDYKTLLLDAHSSLSTDQKKLVLSDYNKNKPFKINLRTSMIKYFIKYYNIAVCVEDDPKTNPLFLSNADELKEYLLI